MRKSVRRVLFYLFFGAFCILAPLVVLYTAGYRFSIKSGIDLDVGSLSITTAPRRAYITVNGVLMKDRTPHVFQELRPGRHRVELTRADFLPWRGVVSVVPGLTTYLQHIVLFRDSIPVAVLSELAAADVVDMHNGYAAYTQQNTDSTKTLFILNTRSGRAEEISTFAGNDALTLSWSPTGDYLLASTGTQGTYLYTKYGKDISPDWLAAAVDGHWDSNEDSMYFHAYTESGYTYSSYSPETQQKSVALEPTTLAVVESSVFFIKQSFTSSILAVKQMNGTQEQELVSLPRSEYTLADMSAPHLALQDAQGDLLMVNPTARTVTQIPSRNGQFEWNKNTDEIAYTDGTELNLLTLQQQQRDMLLRAGAPLTKIAWHPSGQRLLFASGGTLSAIDVYQYGFERDQVVLASFDNIETFWLDQKGRTVYVLGALQGKRGLFSVRLR